MPRTHPGYFIALEGPDGSGKTTQAARLVAWLRERFPEVVACRDPGGTPLGEQLRSILLGRTSIRIGLRAEMLLYMASRAQMVDDVIRPAARRRVRRRFRPILAVQCGLSRVCRRPRPGRDLVRGSILDGRPDAGLDPIARRAARSRRHARRQASGPDRGSIRRIPGARQGRLSERDRDAVHAPCRDRRFARAGRRGGTDPE